MINEIKLKYNIFFKSETKKQFSVMIIVFNSLKLVVVFIKLSSQRQQQNQSMATNKSKHALCTKFWQKYNMILEKFLAENLAAAF